AVQEFHLAGVVGRTDVCHIAGIAPVFQSFLQVAEIIHMMAAEPAANVKACRLRSRHLLKMAKSLDENVQTLLGADAGEVADSEGPIAARRSRLAVAL